jgi:hypothetical protein
LGYWFAKESLKGDIQIDNRTAKDLIIKDGKPTNYTFVSQYTSINEIERMFHDNGMLDSILITKDGNPNGRLLGIIRPRDIFKL